MIRLFLLALISFLSTSCGSEIASQTKDDEPAAAPIAPSLQAKADGFVAACVGAIEFGAQVLQPECECIAQSITDYIPQDEAGEFFDTLTPYYGVEDKKRRDDLTDRFWRDHIIGLTNEQRVYWNEMLTEAFPVCRGEG